jgi:Domain of unknown function (DUF4397)
VSASLAEGTTYTFAVFGRSDSLETDLLTDDLTAPGAGQARVRIIQGAGDSGPVDVTTSAGALFTDGARLGAVGSYATVPAGAVEVTASADGVDDVTQSLELAAGTVSSVVVLDQPTGGACRWCGSPTARARRAERPPRPACRRGVSTRAAGARRPSARTAVACRWPRRRLPGCWRPRGPCGSRR